MFTKTTTSKILAIVGIVLMISIMLANQVVYASSSIGMTSSQIQELLTNYSQLLESGTTSHKEYYSAPIMALAQERREFYQEFFTKGLHVNLMKIDSSFETDKEFTTVQKGKSYILQLDEVVTFQGEPFTKSPEEYPLIQAAQWALENATSAETQDALKAYIESMTEGVLESAQNGVEITFVIRHTIEIDASSGKTRIVRDSFTDKGIDNPDGFDVVEWSTDTFVRREPKWEQMPDYVIYNVSIEELGKILLDDYSAAYAGSVAPTGTGFYYNRSAAKNYINTYTSATSKLCPGSNPADQVFQDTSKYNTSYKYLWQVTGCNDCVDYVSQALRQGGFPTDSTWYPQIQSYAWNVTDGLLSYLNGLAALQTYSCTSLQVGDIAFASSMSHAVMIGGVNPLRFSGHTRDRKLYAVSSAPSLTICRHVKNYIP